MIPTILRLKVLSSCRPTACQVGHSRLRYHHALATRRWPGACIGMVCLSLLHVKVRGRAMHRNPTSSYTASSGTNSSGAMTVRPKLSNTAFTVVTVT